MTKQEKILLELNFLSYLVLAVFSYAYVDLNLTLSQNSLILSFVGLMQQLGYFHRAAASSIYVLFLVFSFTFFIYNLWLFYKFKVSFNYLKTSVLINTIILVFAYPFLSSDLFNYLFDAKIILNYHASPYTHRALDFPSDEWLRFMRWIHRYSPYGPLWLGISTIPAFLGFGKFILNLFTFKIFIGSFHLVNTYLIYKILQKINPKFLLFGTSFYALNPLFLIEGIANAHNDIVLAAFLLGTTYFLIVGKTKLAIIALAAGMLIKYLSVLTIPWLFLVKIKKLDYQKFVFANIITLSIFTYLFSSFRISVPFVSSGATQVQFQPWYLFWTLPLVALIPKVTLIVIGAAISFGALLRYLPFLYHGDWSQPNTQIFMQVVTIIVPLIVALILIFRRFFAKNGQN